MKKEPLISKQQIEEFEKIFANEKNIDEFKDFLNSLESDEARIELIKTQDKILDDIVCLEDRKEHLLEFLNSIKSYDNKLDFISEIYDGFRYGMLYFHYEVLDILQPEDIKKIIKKKDLETESKLYGDLIVTTYDLESYEPKWKKILRSKKIFFEDDDASKDENYKILCDAKVNFQILSLLANSNDFGVSSDDLEHLLMYHIKKIKEELPENPLPDIYAEMMSKVDSDQVIELSEDQKLFLRRSKLQKHSSYFIFHVNAQNQLTKISYCDGNKVSDRQSIVGSRTHINSITNYELANPIDFSAEFADKFIKENSQNQDIIDFYNKISAENFKFKGLEETSISSITYEMPREEQKRGNCAIKSGNILACAILQLKDPSQEFIWDKNAKKPAGKGYENYKEFKYKLADLSIIGLGDAVMEIFAFKPQKDSYRLHLFDAMKEAFLERISRVQEHFTAKQTKTINLEVIGVSINESNTHLGCLGTQIDNEISRLPQNQISSPRKELLFWRGSARFLK